MAFYVICDDDSRHEGMTKEQILAAIAQAIETGSIGDCDTGFVTKLKETNSGRYVTVWVGTQAQYNALNGNIEQNCLYIITDETDANDFDKAIKDILERLERLETATSVDISNHVTLTITGQPSGLSVATILDKEYKYNPTLGVVFFTINLMLIGTFTGTEALTIQHGGSYGKNVGNHAPCVCCDGNLSAYYYGSGNDSKISIEGNASDVVPKYNTATYISGWYFCNGEG